MPTEIHIELMIPDALSGQRLDKAAALLIGEYSRSELSRWIDSGELTLDGQAVRPRSKVLGGEQLLLHTTTTARQGWQTAQAMTLDVLYEDEHVLVINKPAGLVVHPGAGNAEGTLINGLLGLRPQLAELPRCGVVHRLDKDTSGVMVVAASHLAHVRLTEMIQQRDFERRYTAVAEGRMIAGQDIDAPIGRDPKRRTRQAVREDGKPAQTFVRVQARYRTHTLVSAQLHTGRTHQIRVHLANIGHPLVGDSLYGARRRLPAGADPALVALLQRFPRQALHAKYLAFAHPETGDALAFDLALPTDLTELVDALHADAVEFSR